MKKFSLITILVCFSFFSGCIWPFTSFFPQTNDSIEMQKPNQSESNWAFPDTPKNRDRAIVFVHGIFGDAFSTWKNTKGKYFFDFMNSDKFYDNADIYVYGFPSRFYGSAFTIDEAASGLQQHLKDDHVLDHNQIIFVTHSMGGLVAQRFLLTYRNISQKVPLLFFYSTPQEGEQITRVADIVTKNPGIKTMLPFNGNQYLQNLDAEWKQALADGSKTKNGFKTEIRCAYEKLPTFGIIIVGIAGATRNCIGTSAPVTANHINIVKINSDRDEAYIALRNAVKDVPPPLLFDKGAPWLSGSKGMPQMNADFMRLTKSTASVQVIKQELAQLRQPHLDLIALMETAKRNPSSFSHPSQLVSLDTYLAMAYYQLAAIAKYRALDEKETQIARIYHMEAIDDAEACVKYAKSGLDLFKKIMETNSADLAHQMGTWSEDLFQESKQKLQQYHYSNDLTWYHTAGRAILSYYDKVSFRDAYEEVMSLKASPLSIKDPPDDDPTMKWVLDSKDGMRPQRDQNTETFLRRSQ